MSKFTCQMYGLRKFLEEDCDATFKKIKEIGFDNVQLDGMRGNDPHVVAEALNKYNLKVTSMHIKHNRFISDVDGIIEEGKLFNCREVYLKYIDDEFQVEYGYKFTKYAFDKAAKKLIDNGFKVGFHSPEYDFNTFVDGKKVMDYMCEKTDGMDIYPEPDTYWLSVAGEDPLKYISKYSNRILTIHFKDIDLSKNKMSKDDSMVECGKGDVNFKEIMEWGEKNGIKSYAIEQDVSKKNMFDSMKESLDYLKGIYAEILSK